MFHNETKGIVTKVIDLKCNLKTSHYNRKALDSSFTFGGIFSDFELAWLYSGPILKIVNVSDGVILSSLDFSNVTHDSKTVITNVIEYPICDNSRIPTKENQICIIVSYSSKRDANKCTYISFCHPRTSRILHTITTKEKVTCLSLIATRKDHSCPIGGLVKLMSGALALGTKNGNLLILDIKDMFSCVRRNSFDPFQTRFSEMLVLDTKLYSENEIKDKLCKLDNDAYHIAISLSDKKESRDSNQEICVLSYISQGTTLAVGLRSGVFLLWDVSTLKKLYKSASLPVPTPVVRFGFHEPCNDPQNFCYLWVLHESDRKDQTCLPYAVMYGVLYKRVITIPSYGRHYKNFVHCKKRFDLDMDLEQCINGRCITSSVVSNTPSNILRHVTVNEEDPSKINLFVMIFETWERDDDLNSCISLVVFDMNQWYKAQMPHQCYPGFSVPFINFMLLERVSERKSSILDVQIKKDTIQQFLTFNLSEEYSYPSSLSFDTIFLSDSKIVYLRVPGAQRSVLERIVKDGPSGLINPSKYYTECKEAGLRPCFSETYNNVIIPSQIQQRNYVLTILLENKMSSFLVRCVKEWADGSRGVSGCTLPNLIQWAWECITRIKQSTDTICIPLFDYSGDDLDRENYQKLKHCCQLIHVIRDLFAYIHKNYKHYLLDDTRLKQQIDTLQLVTKYFDVIIWCLDCGLLPEKVSSSTDKCVPTYMLNIIQYTEQRRQELRNVAISDKYFLIENSTLYLIDSVLENEPKGKKLQLQWERESGGMSNGLYPPVTLQSMLRIFLMSDLPIDLKHFIMIYFLLDVCDYHRDEDMKEQLFSFSVVFSIDKPYFSLIQACWLFDHEKFEEAADILLMDAVITELQNNQKLYKTMLQACVCQKQYALALKFERLIKLSSFVFADERFYITLLLQNGLVMEAYTTLKKICFGQKILLQHFFKVCDDLGLLKEIFKFPITPEEEEEFMAYLDSCQNRDAGDLKIMYLLSRARYVEAVDVNHNLSTLLPKFGIIGHDTTKQNSNKGRTTTRDLLVNAFSRTLPGVTNELITFCRKEKDKIYRFKEVAKPTPLSVVVHADTSQQVPTYKSSFESVLQAAISKTAETWTRLPKMSDRIKGNDSFVKNTPFLRSDIMTPRKCKSNLLFNREKMNFDDKKPDDNEPPSKRLKRSNFDATFENHSEMNCSESLVSPPFEVTKILRTPHVQKRLNKLLENTPEPSPLTSILKSSEISRFKQPQKVGFSVPEVNRRTPRRVADAQTNTPTKLDKPCDDPFMKKSLLSAFDNSPNVRTDDSAKNEVSAHDDVASPQLSDSLNTSAAAESYYSLESDNDEIATPGLANFSALETDTLASKHFMESMSDEDIKIDRKRIVMEVMSDGEMVEENMSTSTGSIVVPPSVVRQESVILHEQYPPLQEDAVIQLEKVVVPEEDSTSVPRQQSTIMFHEQNLSSQDEPYVENAYLSVSIDDEKEMYSLDAVEEEENPFFSNENFEEVRDEVKPNENVSFVPLQPVTMPPIELKSESPVKDQFSMYDGFNEQPAGYSSQFVEKDMQFEENEEHRENFLEITQPTLHEEFSLETYEKEETINEAGDAPAYESTEVLDHSVTEIKDTSSEEDSDIEIVEARTTISAKVEDQLNDATTEENDDMSEKTYESDYSYSQESADGESFAGETESVVNDDDALDELEALQEEYEDEEEEGEIESNAEESETEEEEAEEAEDEEEAENEVDVDAEEAEAEEAFEKKVMEKEKLEESDEYEQESVHKDNPEINYEELRRIVSNIAAAEAKANEANEQVKETPSGNKQLLSVSLSGFSETEASVCEIFDMTQSVLEETVHMEYSDFSKIEDASTNEISKNETEIVNVDVDDDRENEKSVSVNESRKENTSVEILSLSSIEPSKSLEGPPMVFYFGENSVTSIAEELLSDEPQKEYNVSKQEEDKAHLLIDDSRSVAAEKWEPIDEDQESFRENDESSSSGNVASEKPEGFEVEESGCLTATQPECNIHYIEKIDIEDGRQYERFEGDQYCNAGADQNREEKGEVYVQLEPEKMSNEQKQPFRYQSVIVAGEEERAQDLSQHDEAAREAREVSRFADGSGRDISGCVSAEKRYQVDSIDKAEKKSKSMFLSQPDTTPLDLVMAANVSAETDAVSIDPVLRSVNSGPSMEDIMFITNTAAEIEVDSSDSAVMISETTCSPKKISVSSARSTKLPSASADTTYTVHSRPQASDVTYTVDAKQSAKDATYTVDSHPVKSDATYVIDCPPDIISRSPHSTAEEVVKNRAESLVLVKELFSEARDILPKHIVKKPLSPKTQVSGQTSPENIVNSGEAMSSSSRVRKSSFKQSSPTVARSATFSVSSVSPPMAETTNLIDKTIVPLSDSIRSASTSSVLEKSIKYSLPPAANTAVDEASAEVSSTERTFVADTVAQPAVSVSEPGAISQPLLTMVPEVVSSPRRSMRIARRQSIDSIPDVHDDDISIISSASPKRLPRRRSLAKELEDNVDDDDAMSIKSGSSVAESIASRVSTSSNRSQKRSYTRLEMRKSMAKGRFKMLEVIASDEEEQTSPVKSAPRTKSSRNYAASDPGDQPAYSRMSKRSRAESEYSDDDRLSTVSDVGSKKPKRNVRRKSDSKMLNEGMLRTPSPVRSRMQKLVSSTPMALNLIENKESKPSTASKDYTSSRRLTRFQKTLLECGIQRVERNEVVAKESHRTLENVPEENESFDSEQDFPDGSLIIDEDEAGTEPVIRPARKLRLIDAKKTKKTAKRAPFAQLSPPGTSKQVNPVDVSSDESCSSKASAGSRKRKSRPSTYSSMELRRSTARRNFRPLAVIPSDEESSSFQTPLNVSRVTAEDEFMVSSPDSSPSKARRAARSKKAESDISDRESSSVSDISSISSSVTTRRMRRSLAGDMSVQTGKEKQSSEPPSSPAKQYATDRRLTRTQKAMMEKKSLQGKSKKK